MRFITFEAGQGQCTLKKSVHTLSIFIIVLKVVRVTANSFILIAISHTFEVTKVSAHHWARTRTHTHKLTTRPSFLPAFLPLPLFPPSFLHVPNKRNKTVGPYFGHTLPVRERGCHFQVCYLPRFLRPCSLPAFLLLYPPHKVPVRDKPSLLGRVAMFWGFVLAPFPLPFPPHSPTPNNKETHAHTLDKNGSLYDPAGTESWNVQTSLDH